MPLTFYFKDIQLKKCNLNKVHVLSFNSSHTTYPRTSYSIYHGNDFTGNVSVSSPQYSIDTTSLHNSNEEIHQNVSLVVR